MLQRRGGQAADSRAVPDGGELHAAGFAGCVSGKSVDSEDGGAVRPGRLGTGRLAGAGAVLLVPERAAGAEPHLCEAKRRLGGERHCPSPATWSSGWASRQQ